MKKSSLKSGVHSVVFRNGDNGLYDGKGFNIIDCEGDYWYIDRYSNELEHNNDNQWDVIKITETNTLWQREEKVVTERPKKEDYVHDNGYHIAVESYVDYLELAKPEAKKEEPKEEKKPFVIEYDGCGAFFINISSVAYGYDGKSENYIKHGRYRKTKENAEYSQKRNQIANRLEALVEELQGELGVGSYQTILYKGDIFTQKMKAETYKTICEMLNNEEYSLGG